jgi:son of sevenless-like protein
VSGARPLLGDTVPTTLSHGSSATPSPRGASASTSTVDPSDPPPTPHQPPTSDPLTLSLLDLHPVEVARQLTLIDHELLRRTRLGEWFDCSWTGDAARDEAPTIVTLVNHFNSVSRWVSTAIVSAPDVDSRVVLLKRFLIAAHACAELRNLNGVMQILSGVEAFAVHRLRKTWAALPKQSHKLYEELCELVAIDDGDLAGFRQRMAQCALPCLPYVGPYLASLQQLDEASLTFSETGDVNFEKLAAKADIVLELKTYMDARFNLTPVATVQQFLRSQPLKTDDELTKLSLIAEPLSGK